MPASLSGGGGGGEFPDFFFASFTLWGKGAVHLPDRPPGWKAQKKGGGGRGRFAPPPWIRHCTVYVLFNFASWANSSRIKEIQ